MAGSEVTGMTDRERWLKVEIACPPTLADPLSNFLTEIGAQGVIQEEPDRCASGDFPEPGARAILVAYLPADVRCTQRTAALQRYIESLSQIFAEGGCIVCRTETIAHQDWGEAWKSYFKPLRVSRNIVIKPTWERFSPAGRDVVIDIDPGMAFGTGQHPSTRMCIQAVEDILLKEKTFPEWRVLDVGTGTGIIGIACAKLGADRVVSVDIDKKAAEIAAENVLINGVGDRVAILNQDVQSIRQPFELIVANLTAKLLVRLRAQLTALVVQGGFLVVSGIVEQNRTDMESHFLGKSWGLHRLLTEREWLCYVLRKGNGLS